MAMEKPAVGDLISVRFQGKRYQGYVSAVRADDERFFSIRLYDTTVNDGKDIDKVDSGFHTNQQKGWTLHKTLQTCNG